jgi:hypothetical protein
LDLQYKLLNMRPNEMFFNLLKPQLQVGSITGGTITDSGQDTIISFTQSGSISFLGYGTASLLVVGRAAGGIRVNLTANTVGYSGKGGYGGEVLLYNNYSFEPSSFNISIGTGGLGNTTGGTGGTGSSTLFGSLSASGGVLNNLSNATYGFTDVANQQYTAAGGGGSNGLQLRGSGNGGWGITSSISGSSIVYGAGGGGGGMTTGNQINTGGESGGGFSTFGDGGISPAFPTACIDGKAGIYGGGGGGGASHTTSTTASNSSGGNGGDGIVIIRFTRK